MRYYNVSYYGKHNRTETGKVVEVGSDGIITDIRDSYEFTPDTDDVDCHGDFLLPPFMDCAVTLPGKDLFDIDLSPYNTVNEYVSHITKVRKSCGIRAFGLNETVADMDAYKRLKKLLDTLCPTEPAYILSDDMTLAVVNEVVLSILKDHVHISTEMHTCGLIDMYQIAVLRDKTHVLDFSVEECKRALLSMQEKFVEVGVVAIRATEIIGGTNMITALRELQESGEWVLRTIIHVPVYHFDSVDTARNRFASYTVLNGAQISVTGISLTLDGSVDSGQAAIIEPYENMGTWCGDIMWTSQKLNDVLHAFSKLGVDVNFNAFGDRAVSSIVSFVQMYPELDMYITHAYLVSEIDIELLRGSKVTFCVEPCCSPYGDTFYTGDVMMLGDRAYQEYPIGALMYKGANVVAGSNYPTQPEISPIVGIYRTTNRECGYNPSAYSLLQSYSAKAYSAFHLGYELGEIEIGKPATFVFVDKDFLYMKESLLCDCFCTRVVINGKVG